MKQPNFQQLSSLNPSKDKKTVKQIRPGHLNDYIKQTLGEHFTITNKLWTIIQILSIKDFTKKS